MWMGGGECVLVSECMSVGVGVSGCGCVVVYGIWVSECVGGGECVLSLIHISEPTRLA